ncbi:hypothetical protein C8R47DRAFT_1209128 [Mycena vitilis]|nr:hypothetical protein C8R47DRAFT_1209128 [Mycena vitilis]
MPQFENFNAWITIGGEPAEEYDVETSEDQKTVTCWIASQLGKRFSVQCTVPFLPSDVAGYVTMDGTDCGSSAVRAGFHDNLLLMRGLNDGTVLKPFIIIAISLSSSSHEELGLIELVVAPVEIPGRALFQLPSLPQVTVHERCKKGVTQQVTVAEPENAGPVLVTFCFKYRPLDLLRAKGIAPPPPQLKRKASAGPVLPSSRAQTPDDSEDLEALREKLKVLEAKLIKREKKPRVKTELEGGGGEQVQSANLA